MEARKMTDQIKLRAAIVASGLSARRWAVEVAEISERTIRRYLAGDVAIHPRILRLISRPPPSRRDPR